MEKALEFLINNTNEIDNVAVYFIERDHAILECYKGYFDKAYNNIKKVPSSKNYIWEAIYKRTPIYVNDVCEDNNMDPAIKNIGVKSYATIPLLYEGKVVGVINATSFSKYTFSGEVLSFIEFIAHYLELIISKTKKLRV